MTRSPVGRENKTWTIANAPESVNPCSLEDWFAHSGRLFRVIGISGNILHLRDVTKPFSGSWLDNGMVYFTDMWVDYRWDYMKPANDTRDFLRSRVRHI